MGKTGQRRTRWPFRNRARDATGCVAPVDAIYIGADTEQYSGRLHCRTTLDPVLSVSMATNPKHTVLPQSPRHPLFVLIILKFFNLKGMRIRFPGP
jgi:hypothetical protein